MRTTGRLLLDTNIVIALLEGDEAVLSNLEGAPEEFIPAIVVGELFFGAAKSGRPSENSAIVERIRRREIGPFVRSPSSSRVWTHEAAASGEKKAAARKRYLDCRHCEGSRISSRYKRPTLS